MEDRPEVAAEKFGKLEELLNNSGGITRCFVNVSEFVEFVRETSARWQNEDLDERERDPEYTLNDARIVGQIWFRGQRDSARSLRPGLYRDETWAALMKSTSRSQQTDIGDDDLFEALFDVEHDQRVDFTNYGHLLNESNQARTPIDWYFLMQHHGIPTRLLDWTTNALAGLFFALEAYSRKAEEKRSSALADPEREKHENCVAVWMLDAYWVAARLSREWGSPILPYSEDAARYVPPLDKLIDRASEATALVPKHPMPIEPPAMHPRVAAQEGRFIIFGRTRDLLDERIVRKRRRSGAEEEIRLKQIRFKVGDVNAVLQELAHLGVSKRTLFPDLAGLADFVRWKHFHKIGGYNLEFSG